MQKRRILVCPPSYYKIAYSINPWMNTEVKIQKSKVKSTYQKLKVLYEKLGAEVLEIKPDPDLPDMVYSANYGFIRGNTFFPSNFKYEERRREAKQAKKYFKDLGFKINEIPKNIFFEGQPDLVLNHTAYFLGWGPRTNMAAKKYFEKILDKPIIDLELIDPYFFHLDNSFMMLDDYTVVYNPKAFSKKALQNIKRHFRHRIKVSEADNQLLACNMVVLGKNIVTNKGISRKLKKQIQDLGYKIYEVDMSEYLKGGGSVKCVTFVF